MKNRLISDDQFWELMEYIDSLENDVALKDLFTELEMLEDDILEVVSFLENFNYELKTCEKTGQKILACPNLTTKVQPLLDLSPEEFYLVEVFEKVMEDGNLVELSTHDSKEMKLYLYKIVYLDRHISVVGEDVYSRSLISLQLKDIETSKVAEVDEYNPIFSTLEIDDFVAATRAVCGNEERLVLKIKRKDNIDITPQYQYLGNPYVTANMDGDKIWAASVEVSDGLFAWLASLRDYVEILDPESVRLGLREYCQRKSEEEQDKYKKVS